MKSFSNATVAEFLHIASSDAPTPGGGGVAAIAGCLGTAMGSMAIRFTLGRPKYAEHEEALQGIVATLHALQEDMRAAIDDDATAFKGIAEAYKLPRMTEEEIAARHVAIDEALTASMLVPLRVLRCCGEAAETLTDVAMKGNAKLLSDVAVAAIMLTAAARAAMVNVYANSRSLDTEDAREAEAVGERIVARVAWVDGKVQEIIADRG